MTKKNNQNSKANPVTFSKHSPLLTSSSSCLHNRSYRIYLREHSTKNNSSIRHTFSRASTADSAASFTSWLCTALTKVLVDASPRAKASQSTCGFPYTSHPAQTLTTSESSTHSTSPLPPLHPPQHHNQSPSPCAVLNHTWRGPGALWRPLGQETLPN